MKPIPSGITFEQPLQFGDWPLNKVEKIIAEVNGKYDMSKHELQVVNRGGYVKCQGYGKHEACDDLVPTNGAVVWKRIRP